MNKIAFGTPVLYFLASTSQANGSKIAPAITTRPWSQDNALNLTVFPDASTPFTVSSVMHASGKEQAASTTPCWATYEECAAWGIDLSDAYALTINAKDYQKPETANAPSDEFKDGSGVPETGEGAE
jgi:hypothetical protein